MMEVLKLLWTRKSFRHLSFAAGQVLMTGHFAAHAALLVESRFGTLSDWSPEFNGTTLEGAWLNGRPVVAGVFDRVGTKIRHHLAWFPFAR